MSRVACLATAVAAALAGCAARPDPIPRYATSDRAEAFDILRHRTAALRTVRGEATLTLTDARNQTVTLDGAYVLAKPDSARLRAWKFGQAVFDLTVQGDRAWAFLPRDEARPAAAGLRETLGQWIMLVIGGGQAFDGDAEDDGKLIRVTRPYGTGSAKLRIEIDRATLTPRRYVVFDKDHTHFELILSDYRVVADGQVWPMTIRAVRRASPVVGDKQEVVEIRSHDVEINTDIDPAALKPPARAEALP